MVLDEKAGGCCSPFGPLQETPDPRQKLFRREETSATRLLETHLVAVESSAPLGFTKSALGAAADFAVALLFWNMTASSSAAPVRAAPRERGIVMASVLYNCIRGMQKNTFLKRVPAKTRSFGSVSSLLTKKNIKVYKLAQTRRHRKDEQSQCIALEGTLRRTATWGPTAHAAQTPGDRPCEWRPSVSPNTAPRRPKTQTQNTDPTGS